LKIQKQKTFKHKKKKHIAHFLAYEISHKFFEDPQNDKKKIENFKMLKYQNKRPSKFPKEKQIPHLPPCETSHKKIKHIKMTKKILQRS